MAPCVTRSFLATAAAVLISLSALSPAFRPAVAQDPLVIPLASVLLPWPANNLTQAYQAGSPIAELNLAKVLLGPCTYRMMHYHISADELLVVISGRLESVVVAPNNTVYNHSLAAGDNVVYPKGWMHYQYNPTCRQAQTVLSFNAKSIGSVGVPLALAGATDDYLQAAYDVTRFPEPAGLWVVDKRCARRCDRQ